MRRTSGSEAVELALADFESLASVRALGEELLRRHPNNVALDFEDLQSTRAFSWFRALGASKMCNLLFGFELARRVDPSEVISHVVHPGLVKSSLMKEAPGLVNFLAQLFSGKPDSAAAGIAWLATAPEAAKESGKFWKGREQLKAAPYSQAPESMQRLWVEGARLVGV